MDDYQSPPQGQPADPAADEEDAHLLDFQPGHLIGRRYRVLKKIGRGGMGMVYLVHDLKRNEKLALKCILPKHVHKSVALKRFEREVEAARRLNHPCIVRLYDAWRFNEMLMYTMEYVGGQSLHNMIQERGRLGLGSTVHILSLVCSGLEHAHQFTIHRDISPTNIMVQADGSVKLLDFGLAKITDQESVLTMVGSSLGKAQYMAPEQMINAKEVDLRADLYSLGVVFYQMLTGKLPKGTKPTPISEMRPELPASCDAFAKRAMAPNPSDRFQDARAFRTALGELYAEYQLAKKGVAGKAGFRTRIGQTIRRFWGRLTQKRM